MGDRAQLGRNMSSQQDRAAERKERRQREIQERRANRKVTGVKQERNKSVVKISLIMAGVLLSVLVVYFVYSIVADWRERRPPDGVTEYTGLTNFHTQGAVAYEQSPPVGGDHNPVWQNCGFYTLPLINEHAVHSLEHGAVWITYQPNLPTEQLDVLRAYAEKSYVLVSPYPDGLNSPIVASAWGLQMEFQDATDEDLERFINAYRQGPQTLEPGAVCHGGTSATR